MKKSVSPVALVAAVVVLGVVLFGLYSFFLRPAGPAPSADNAPEYAKQMQQGRRPTYGSSPAPATGTVPGATPNRPGPPYGANEVPPTQR